MVYAPRPNTLSRAECADITYNSPDRLSTRVSGTINDMSPEASAVSGEFGRWISIHSTRGTASVRDSPLPPFHRVPRQLRVNRIQLLENSSTHVHRLGASSLLHLVLVSIKTTYPGPGFGAGLGPLSVTVVCHTILRVGKRGLRVFFSLVCHC